MIKVIYRVPDPDTVNSGSGGTFFTSVSDAFTGNELARDARGIWLLFAAKIVSLIYGAAGELILAAQEEPHLPAALNPGSSIRERLPLKRVGDPREPAPSRADAVLEIQLLQAGVTRAGASFRNFQFGVTIHLRLSGGENPHVLADVVVAEHTQPLPRSFWTALDQEDWRKLTNEIEAQLAERIRRTMVDLQLFLILGRRLTAIPEMTETRVPIVFSETARTTMLSARAS